MVKVFLRCVPHPPMTQAATEDALAGFLQNVPETARLAARAVAHAWESGGGGLAVGKVATRFTAAHDGGTFTAATLHPNPPRLELARATLGRHGVTDDAWMHWSDELADLQARGFDAASKYPILPLELREAELARTVTSLRDLARICS